MKRWNSHREIRNFFGENKPVTMDEFEDFWGDLSASDQVYFMAASLETQQPRKDYGETYKEFWEGLSEAEQNAIIYNSGY